MGASSRVRDLVRTRCHSTPDCNCRRRPQETGSGAVFVAQSELATIWHWESQGDRPCQAARDRDWFAQIRKRQSQGGAQIQRQVQFRSIPLSDSLRRCRSIRRSSIQRYGPALLAIRARGVRPVSFHRGNIYGAWVLLHADPWFRSGTSRVRAIPSTRQQPACTGMVAHPASVRWSFVSHASCPAWLAFDDPGRAATHRRAAAAPTSPSASAPAPTPPAPAATPARHLSSSVLPDSPLRLRAAGSPLPRSR